MADFNQSPSGQAPFELAMLGLDMTLTDNALTVAPGFAPTSFAGATGTFSFAQVESGTFDMYPSYRRPIRLIASTPAT
jgi:hypothetical protein